VTGIKKRKKRFYIYGYCVASDIQSLCSSLACDQTCEVAMTQTRVSVAYCVCVVGFVRVRVNEGTRCSCKSHFAPLLQTQTDSASSAHTAAMTSNSKVTQGHT